MSVARLLSVALLPGTLLATAPGEEPTVGPEFRIVTPERGNAAFSPDGRMLLTGPGTRSGSVAVWDVQSGNKVSTLAESAGIIGAVAWSPDGRWAVAAGTNEQITVWDARNWRKTHVLKAHTAVIHSIAFSPDGRLLASGSSDRSVLLWDLATGSVIHTLAHPGRRGNSEPSLGIPGMVFAVAFSPDGKKLASGGGDGVGRTGELILWDIESGKQVRRFAAIDEPQVWTVTFSPDGQLLASGTTAGTVKFYEVLRGEVQWELRGARGLRSLTISSNGRTLAAGFGGDIRLYDMDTRKMTGTLRGRGKWVGSLDFSPDGKLLASGDSEGIKLWRIAE